jgi:hypothetical protein
LASSDSAYFYVRVILWITRWIPYLAMVGGERSPGLLAARGAIVMRPRLPCPVRPFDVVPPPVVEGSKLIFRLRAAWQRTGALGSARQALAAPIDGRLAVAWEGPSAPASGGECPAGWYP